MRLGLWCLTPISTIFQLHRGVQFLLVKETGVSGENHWQSLSHNVVSSTPCHERGCELTTLVVIGTDCTGSCKSNYHRIMAMMAPKNTNKKTFRSGAFSRKGNELPFFNVPLNHYRFFMIFMYIIEKKIIAKRGEGGCQIGPLSLSSQSLSIVKYTHGNLFIWLSTVLLIVINHATLSCKAKKINIFLNNNISITLHYTLQ